jgi:type VI secretion system ImpB/VipA family protein
MRSKVVVELPLVIGVLADLAGDHPVCRRTPLKQRAFARVNRDNFGDLFRSIGPGRHRGRSDRSGPCGS